MGRIPPRIIWWQCFVKHSCDDPNQKNTTNNNFKVNNQKCKAVQGLGRRCLMWQTDANKIGILTTLNLFWLFRPFTSNQRGVSQYMRTGFLASWVVLQNHYSLKNSFHPHVGDSDLEVENQNGLQFLDFLSTATSLLQVRTMLLGTAFTRNTDHLGSIM